MKALLALEDGTVFEGVSCGVSGEVEGVVVFNTAVVGFQELITDPASRGEILTFTYPLVGNYGVCDDAMESDAVQCSGIVVRELSAFYSNFRAKGSFGEFVKSNNLVGVSEVDTRALAVHLRDCGEMRGVVSTVDLDRASLVEKARDRKNSGPDRLGAVTTSQKRIIEPLSGGEARRTVAVLDLGVRRSDVRQLRAAGCRLIMFPRSATADELRGSGADRLFLSGGPSTAEPPPDAVDTVKALLGTMPIFGTGLGHNVLGASLGCPSVRMRIGHRGVNHPVRALESRHVEITAQNHGMVLDRRHADSTREIVVTHEQINDRTVEGIRSRSHPAFSVQYVLSVVEKDEVHPHVNEFLAM